MYELWAGFLPFNKSWVVNPLLLELFIENRTHSRWQKQRSPSFGLEWLWAYFISKCEKLTISRAALSPPRWNSSTLCSLEKIIIVQTDSFNLQPLCGVIWEHFQTTFLKKDWKVLFGDCDEDLRPKSGENSSSSSLLAWTAASCLATHLHHCFWLNYCHILLLYLRIVYFGGLAGLLHNHIRYESPTFRPSPGLFSQ